MQSVVPHKTVEKVVSNWPENPRKMMDELVDDYGEPDEFTDTKLIWHNTADGWKRTILSKDETPHNFPHPHADFLEQSINYKVPIDKYSQLAKFDGSVFAERTKGELAVRGGSKAMNFAAINLAHDILVGERTAQEARDEYTYLYKSYMDGKKLPYAKNFQFDLPKANTADPDSSTIS